MDRPTPDDEDAQFLKALEEERGRLIGVRNLREHYIERLNELSDRNWAGNSGVDETNRLGEIEDIKTRLQNMESWDAQYIQRIAEGEEIFRKKKSCRNLNGPPSNVSRQSRTSENFRH
jgi:hypothetical protein